MTKIGIITMHSVLNYGSYLQTLATYKFIEKQGLNPIIIDYRYPTQYHKKYSINLNKSSQTSSISKPSLWSRIILKLAYYIIGYDRKKKENKFSAFYNKYIKLTPPYYSEEELNQNPPKCDTYIVGSDQVWNPLFIHHDKSFFLSWVPKGCKKISYASSVAIKNIPEEFINDFTTELSTFSAISVREESYTLKKILNREIKCVLDPTFLLNKKEWTRYFGTIPIVKHRYILCYILSYSYNPYPYIYDVIEKARKELGYKVVIIDGNPAEIYNGYKIYTNIGPSEFLNLFYNAEFVITTSFHGTAFSINFNKDFVSIINDISSNDNRILSLTKQTGLTNDCIIYKNTPIDQIHFPHIDYQKSKIQLETLRQDSINYLKNALNN